MQDINQITPKHSCVISSHLEQNSKSSLQPDLSSAQPPPPQLRSCHSALLIFSHRLSLFSRHQAHASLRGFSLCLLYLNCFPQVACNTLPSDVSLDITSSENLSLTITRNLLYSAVPPIPSTTHTIS